MHTRQIKQFKKNEERKDLIKYANKARGWTNLFHNRKK